MMMGHEHYFGIMKQTLWNCMFNIAYWSDKTNNHYGGKLQVTRKARKDVDDNEASNSWRVGYRNYTTFSTNGITATVASCPWLH